MAGEYSKEYSRGKKTGYYRKPKELYDIEAGEYIPVEQVFKRVYGSRHFWKLYMNEFLPVLRVFRNRQLDVLIYILEHIQSADNTFIGTYQRISKDCGVSMDTVRRTMQSLQEVGFLKKIQNGVYVISPNILVKGDDTKKGKLAKKFEETARNPDDNLEDVMAGQDGKDLD